MQEITKEVKRGFMSSEMRLSAWVGKLGSVLPREQRKAGQRLLSAFGRVDTIAILAKVAVCVPVCVCVWFGNGE